MNIRLPFQWLKERLDTQLDAIGFAEAMTLVGNESERILYQKEALKGVVIGRVQKVLPHPKADKLNIVMTDIGRGADIQIVCGGTNVAAGQRVAVALPGAIVKWHGDVETTLQETEVRGVKSAGMICAAEEIGFEKLSVAGAIWDLSTIVPDARPGTPLARALELEDEVVLDMEVTTNRPDAMSVVGMAREGHAASLGELDDPMLKEPQLPSFLQESPYVFNVQVDEQKLCPRYMALVLDVRVGPSPWWLQKRLLLAGARPINNIVDVTNYVRLEFGQPLHAFDYRALEGSRLEVRRARDGERFLALDEHEYTLTRDMLVIADARGPVALAGVMGGHACGVTSDTTTIVLEAATFDPRSIRATWRALNVSSDSQQLFEKGLSVELPAYGMARAVELLREVAGGVVQSRVFDVRAQAYEPRSSVLRPERTSALMGVRVEADIQRAMLMRLGFSVDAVVDGAARVTVPFWRDHDIEGDTDLIEEIARLYGYHHVPSVLPIGAIPRRDRDVLLAFEEQMKDALAAGGCTEVYANSFMDPDDMRRAEMNVQEALRVANPLAEDQAVMRTSLIPTALRVVAQNQAQAPLLRLFELARVYRPREGDLPEERSSLLVVMTDAHGGEMLWRHGKGALDILMAGARVEYALERGDAPHWAHPGRAARIVVDGEVVGTIGEVHPILRRAFGLDIVPVFVELDVPRLATHARAHAAYREPPVFPRAYRDVALVVDEAVAYEAVEAAVREASVLVRVVELFDVYRGSQVGEGRKSLALHLALGADERTLSSEDIEAAMDAVSEALRRRVQAIIRDGRA